MANRIVLSDSGPLIHLSEAGAEFAWGIFPKVWVPEVVNSEVSAVRKAGFNILTGERFDIYMTTEKVRESAEDLVKEHTMGTNDALVLASAILIKADLLLTDDLELREFSRSKGIAPVGSIGILLRAFKEDKCDLRKLLDMLDRLYSESSLYITFDLVEKVKTAAIEFQKHND